MISNDNFDWQKWQQEQEHNNTKPGGGSKYVKLGQGETKLTLLKVPPRPQVSSYGTKQMVFRVKKDGEEYDWAVSTRNPIYMRIVRRMNSAPLEVIVVRNGIGLQTKWSLIE